MFLLEILGKQHMFPFFTSPCIPTCRRRRPPSSCVTSQSRKLMKTCDAEVARCHIFLSSNTYILAHVNVVQSHKMNFVSANVVTDCSARYSLIALPMENPAGPSPGGPRRTGTGLVLVDDSLVLLLEASSVCPDAVEDAPVSSGPHAPPDTAFRWAPKHSLSVLSV